MSYQLAQIILSVLFVCVHSYSHVSTEAKPKDFTNRKNFVVRQFMLLQSVGPWPRRKYKMCSHLHHKTHGTFRNWHCMGNFHAAEHIYWLMCDLKAVFLFCQLSPTPPSKKEKFLKSFAYCLRLLVPYLQSLLQHDWQFLYILGPVVKLRLK